MKQIFSTLCIIATLVACKKETTAPVAPHEKGIYEVLSLGKGNDTSFSGALFARTETVGLVVVEDSKLKAVLTAYQKLPNGEGRYTVQVTSKLTCQGIVRWSWEGLRIESISPTSDVIQAGMTQTFVLTGTAKVGKIKLKIESQCGISSTLIIHITMDVLPINYLEKSISYNEKTGKVTITFTIDDPSQVEWIMIRKYEAGEWKQKMLVACDQITKKYAFTF